MKCDTKCYNNGYHNGAHGQQYTNNVRTLVTFFLVYISIDWREEFYMR